MKSVSTGPVDWVITCEKPASVSAAAIAEGGTHSSMVEQ
jgi:hypothetical protein